MADGTSTGEQGATGLEIRVKALEGKLKSLEGAPAVPDTSDRVKVLEDALLQMAMITRDGSAYGVHRGGAHPVDAILQALPGGADILKAVKLKVARVKCEVCQDSIPEPDYDTHLTSHSDEDIAAARARNRKLGLTGLGKSEAA